MFGIWAKVSALKYCKRAEKNWTVAVGLLNEHPHKLEEYVALKFEMKTFEKRFAFATLLREKLELQAQWEKFCSMEPTYEKVRTKTQTRFTATPYFQEFSPRTHTDIRILAQYNEY